MEENQRMKKTAITCLHNHTIRIVIKRRGSQCIKRLSGGPAPDVLNM